MRLIPSVPPNDWVVAVWLIAIVGWAIVIVVLSRHTPPPNQCESRLEAYYLQQDPVGATVNL